MKGVRFTAYFSDRERAAIAEAARSELTSDNVIVRLAVRQYLSLDDTVPALLPVTSDTPTERAQTV